MGMYREQYTFNFFKASRKEAQEKTQGMAKKMMELLIEADYKEMESLFQECKPIRYSAQGYQEESPFPKEEKETLVNVGYVNAVVDIMQMYLNGLNTQSAIQQIKTKYRDEILSVLSKRGTMLHGDLASALGVSVSALNALIKKMNSTSVKLIHVEEVSKYKLYSITPVAYSYITANKHETMGEYTAVSGTKKNEQLLEHTFEINKIANEKRGTENTGKVIVRKNKSRDGSDKMNKHTKFAADIDCTARFARRLA